MKKLIGLAAVLSACLVLFVSCGGKDDAKKLSPEEQLKKSVSKAFVDNSKLIAHGLSQIKDTMELSNFGDEFVISAEVGEPLQTLVNALLSESDLDYSTQWLNSVQVTAKTGLTDNEVQVSVKAGLNNTDILSVNVYEDSKNSTVYFSVPELIKNNFKIAEEDFGLSVREIMNQYLDQVSFYKNLPEETIFTGFIEEMVNAFVSPITQVSRSTEELKAGLPGGKTVASNYTVLSTILNEDISAGMGETLGNVVRSSSNFNALANWFVPILSKAEGYKIRVKDFTEEFAEEVEDTFEDMFYGVELTLKLFVDSQSNLAGLYLYDDEAAVIACMPQKGNSFGYCIAVSENAQTINTENIYTTAIGAINGYGSYSGGKMTGDFKVYAEGEDLLDFETKNLDITNLKSLKPNGTLTIHPKAETRSMVKDSLEDEFYVDGSLLSFIDNLDMSINMNRKDYNTANYEIVLNSGKTKFAALSYKDTISKPGTIKMPTSDIMALDEDSIEDYEDILDGISTSAIVENLKKAKVAPEYIQPLESLTGEMLGDLVGDYIGGGSSYNYYDDYDYDWW